MTIRSGHDLIQAMLNNEFTNLLEFNNTYFPKKKIEGIAERDPIILQSILRVFSDELLGLSTSELEKICLYHSFLALKFVIKSNNIKAWDKLIGRGANFQGKDEDGRTLCHIVFENGNVEFLNRSLGGISEDFFDVCDNFGNTPIRVAVINSNAELLEWSLRYDRYSFRSRYNEYGHKRVHGIGESTLLHLAAITNNSEIIKLLVARFKDSINSKDRDGNTPLHVAARNNNAEIVQLLLNNKSDVSVKNSDGYTPLHIAAANGSVDVVQVLLNLGTNADINVATGPGLLSVIGSTSLQLALENKHYDVVKILVDHRAKIEVSDLARVARVLMGNAEAPKDNDVLSLQSNSLNFSVSRTIDDKGKYKLVEQKQEYQGNSEVRQARQRKNLGHQGA